MRHQFMGIRRLVHRSAAYVLLSFAILILYTLVISAITAIGGASLGSNVVLQVVLLVLLFVSGFTVARVATAPLDPAALDHDLPLGREVFGAGSPAHRLAQLVSYPAYLLLLAGCAWSAWRMRGRRELRDRFVGTVGVAVGATVVAVASGVGAGFQVVPVFSVGLALGIAVMFWGFLRAARPAPAAA